MFLRALLPAFLVPLPALSAQKACEDATLVASDAPPFARYGLSVAVDGDFAAVGAPFADGAVPWSGAAYVYQRVPGGWAEVAKVWASDGAGGDTFGAHLVLDGERLVVGAIWKDGPGLDAGAVYVFEKQGGAWVETQKLAPSDAAPGDWFGREVGLEDDRLVVGAALKGPGAVYVFEHDGSAWSQTAKLEPSDGIDGDLFGGSLDIDGGRVLVGSHGRDDAGTDSGAAYVYELQGSTWVETAKLTASDPAPEDDFAADVMIHGNTILIASMGDDAAAPDAGSVYVFERDGAAWSQTAELTVPDAKPGDGLGSGMALDGDLAVLGAWLADGSGVDSGAAYVFRRSNGAFVEEAKLSGPVPGGQFGFEIELDGTDVIIGAPTSGAPGPFAGEARIGRLAGDAKLFACPSWISLSQGGVHTLHVGLPANLAGSVYVVAGTTHGTTPGFALGSVAVPLNPDWYFLHTVSFANNPPLYGTAGFLDTAGGATATIALPPGFNPTLAGAKVHHAVVVLDPIWASAQIATEASPLDLLP